MTSSKVCEKKVCEIKMSQNPPIHTTDVDNLSDSGKLFHKKTPL